MKKRILAAVLAVAMILGVAGIAFAASPFPDTDGIEEEGTIALLKTLGLVKGDDLGNFNPEDTITRAEFCAMIVRALGLEAAAGFLATPTVFPDVTEAQSWAYGYINIAVTRGIVKGYPDGTFRPQGPVSQAEALTMVMRALGYKDSLPGEWPLDYILKGAEKEPGLVKSGFIPNTSATRAFVAVMIADTLQAVPHKEDPDTPGYFVPVPGAGQLQETALRFKNVVPSGVVSDINLTDKTLKIGGVQYTYDPAVVVYGDVSSVSALSGYSVTAVQRSTGDKKVVFIATTNLAVSGKVTAVDVINKSLTIADKTYKVVAGFSVEKDGTDLATSTDTNKLIALLDTNATLWLNEDGKVYEVQARLLNTADHVITGKSVEMTTSGTVYKLTLDIDEDGTGDITKPLAKDVTISKNGIAVGWSDLAAGDLVSYSEEGGEIVWIDAFYSVIEMAQVTSKYDLGSAGKQIVALVDGQSVTLTCTTAGFGVSVGDYYNLKLNRDGKVYSYVLKTSAVTTAGGVIERASTELAWVDGAAKTYYKLTLTDGSSIALPYSDANFSFQYAKNNSTLTTPAVANFATLFKVGDSIRISRNAALTVSKLELFSPVFEGIAAYDSGTKTLTVGGNVIPLASGAVVTLDGNTVPVSLLNGVQLVKVYWDAATAKATRVAGFQFADDASAASKIILLADGKYDITLVAGAFTAAKDAVVVRDGEASTLAALQLGDKIRYTLDAGVAIYVEATSDTAKPGLDDEIANNPLAEWVDDDDDKVEVTITFTEETQKPIVYIDGEEAAVADSAGGKVWVATSAQTFASDVDPIVVGISVKDYAGNQFTVTVPNVEINPAP